MTQETGVDRVHRTEKTENAAYGFNARLLEQVRKSDSNLCVGLDPDVARFNPEIWEFLRLDGAWKYEQPGDSATSSPQAGTHRAAVLLSIRTAELCAPFAAALKPNAAFYEGATGGSDSLAEVAVSIEAAAPDAIRVLDAKRGDIGNTSRKYADAAFDSWNYHAVTVNPLMGWDSVEPFTRNPACGVFLLCLTSNPGAEDFLLRNDLYLRIAERAVAWNGNGNVGLVVGATQAAHAARIREIAPELPMLIPGVGAQGGSLSEIIDAINGRDNRAFLVNASRSIMYPTPVAGETYAGAVQNAARSLRDEIRALL